MDCSPVLTYAEFFECGILVYFVRLSKYDTVQECEDYVRLYLSELADRVEYIDLSDRSTHGSTALFDIMQMMKIHVPVLYSDIQGYMKDESTHISEYMFKIVDY